MSPTEFAAIRSQNADLNLSASITDYNVIEITAAQLSDASIRSAITTAGTTTKDDLIVLRTTETQNKITLSGGELAIDFDATEWGSVTIVGFGTNSLTLDADQQSRIFNISNNAEAGLAGLTITNGYCDDSSFAGGGGIYNYRGTLTLYNTIVAKNSTDIYNYPGASGTIPGFNNLTSFTDWNGSSGSNFVYDSSKPLFVNAAQGDYRLAANSQAIDKGSNSYVPSGITKDLAGNARIQGSAVDIGAYEYQLGIPQVTLSQVNGNVTLKWAAIPTATHYGIYRLVNGK